MFPGLGDQVTGFVLLRVRAHRLLLSAAVLAVLLTTSVLAALTGFSGSVGDAALRHTLTHGSAASAALVVSASVDHEQRAEADEAVRKVSRDAFDGLPVTVGKLESSGSYALPRSLQDPAARRGKEPDLTHFTALDPSRVRITGGKAPAAVDGSGPVQVALPVVAAEALKLKPGARLTVTDRLRDKKQRVLVTGVYEAADRSDPYWQLDPLGGRGVRKLAFTTYGPLLTDPSVLASGVLAEGETSWLASADFAELTTGSMEGLREASAGAPKALAAAPVFASGITAKTSLPTVLDQLDRALLVSRSTLMIVAVQLVLLAAYALLLVARLLNSERDGERELLRARGGSRGRITSFAAIEALLLAVPAAVVAPLLAGPLTGLLAERSALSRIGLQVQEASTGTVWLVSAAVALACALAVVAPSLTAGQADADRAASLPGPVRAGADLGLLLIAAVAYWQLDRQSGSGALSGDQAGNLGIDPLLVTAPALALLAGTVLTLRLLPPAAKLAERRAAKGRGLPAALAGWQFSRRPLRGAGPVLLLVLSVAMGMLAIGQSASWNRSQSDQADFGSGAAVRLVGGHGSGPATAGAYSSLAGVRQAAPAYRTDVEVSGGRTAEVLALDTAHADERMLMRSDLADGSPRRLFEAIAPERAPRPGLVLPEDSTRLKLDLRITTVSKPSGDSLYPDPDPPVVTVLLEDRYGLPYRALAGPVPVDGLLVPVSFPVSAAGGPAVTGIEVDGAAPSDYARKHRVSVSDVRVVAGSGAERPVPAPESMRWDAAMTLTEYGEDRPGKPPVRNGASGLPDFTYDTGVDNEDNWEPTSGTLRVTAARPKAAVVKAVATDAYLKSTNAKLGDEIDVNLAGNTVRVTLAESVCLLPTTETAGLSGAPDPVAGGGALLLDLKAVTEVLAHRPTATIEATEWWLSTAPGDAPKAAAALRALPDTDPAQVLVRAEAAQRLVDDPLGAGPQSALPAVAVVAAALAAVGFAVSASGSRRERSAELGVLRALGAPRRQLARMIAAEQGVLIALALLIGLGIGTVLTRAVVPLIVLTGQADRPVPPVLVELPAGQVAALLAGVAALPLVIVATMALRRGDPAVTLRHQGDH